MARPGRSRLRMVQLKVEAVALDWKGQPLVVLREQGGQRAVFIWVGPAEATAISTHLEGQHAPRPMTHDLIMLLLRELGAKVDQVVITDMRRTTYYADLRLNVGDRPLSIDCRPSDAIAVALRASAPIYIDDDLLDRLEASRREAGEAEVPQPTIVDTGETTVH
jgi:bifunctional DNase/RNase